MHNTILEFQFTKEKAEVLSYCLNYTDSPLTDLGSLCEKRQEKHSDFWHFPFGPKSH